jgi:hypothetical protein
VVTATVGYQMLTRQKPISILLTTVGMCTRSWYLDQRLTFDDVQE